MADNQEPDVARRLGGGGNRQGVSGSGERVAATLKDSFKAISEYADKAYKRLADMEKIVDRLNQKVRSGGMGGSGHAGSAATGGRGNAGGATFSGIPSPLGGGSGAGGGASTGGAGGMGGNGGHLGLGLAGFGGAGRSSVGGAGAAAAADAEGAPGGAGGGGIPGGGRLGGALGQAGAAVFKAASSYGSAHLQDAATMELASSRLAISGGSGVNREYWRGAGSGLARLGGYNLDDNVSAALTLSNQGVLATPGQGAFGQYQSQVQQLTNQVGGLGAASASQFIAQSRNTNTIFAGRQIGISTTGKGGVALPPDQIAHNILAQYRGNSKPGSPEYQKEIAAALDQGAGIDQRINALGYSGEQADVLRQDISLISQGKDPTKDGPKNKLDSQTKDTAQSQLETTSQTAKQLADGAADIKHAGEVFRDAVNSLLRGSKLGGLIGKLAGAASQIGGPTSSSAGIAPVRFRSNSQEGGPGGDDTGYLGIEEAVTKLGIKFGTPSAGQTTGGGHAANSEHYQGRAVDFGDATSNPGQIAQALLKYATGNNAPIDELIYSPLNIGMKNGSNIGERGYGAAVWAEHRNHVHVGVRPGVRLADVVSGNASSTASGGTTGGSADEKTAGTSGSSGAQAAGITNSAGDLIAEGSTGSLLGVAPVAGGGSSKDTSKDSSSDGASGGGGGAGPPATGPLQDYAKKLLAQYGWSNQWDSFNKLEMSEAGWDPTISNGGGHGPPQHNKAYGIPQALPPEKMASAGADWATSGYTQLRWMMEYIKTKGVFHDPNTAWAYHQQHNSYAKGSWEIERDQYARIHAGEMVVPAEQADQIRRVTGGRGGGAPVTINVTLNNASESEVMRLVQRVKTEMSRDSVLDMIGAS